MKISACLLIGLILAASSAWADFAAGVEAYDQGRYGEAHDLWLEEAKSGNAQAQMALAELFRQGLGVAQDRQLAAYWYERAARGGEAIAMFMIGRWYLSGVGVTADKVRAYAWLTLAERAGITKASGFLRSMKYQLDDHELSRVQVLVKSLER